MVIAWEPQDLEFGGRRFDGCRPGMTAAPTDVRVTMQWQCAHTCTRYGGCPLARLWAVAIALRYRVLPTGYLSTRDNPTGLRGE